MQGLPAGSHLVELEAIAPGSNLNTDGLFVSNHPLTVPGKKVELETDEDFDIQETTLLRDEDGVFRDPDVSYDGRRILFSWKKSSRADDYHLYEMDFETRQVRQLTYGLGFADYEGIYLPNGDAVSLASNLHSKRGWRRARLALLRLQQKLGRPATAHAALPDTLIDCDPWER